MKRVINYNDDKIFDNWNGVKKRLARRGRRRYFREGDIWWCGVGKNIGTEVYGKNDDFSRPMIVFKKLDGRSFLGICTTSKTHNGNWYIKVVVNGRDTYVNLAQIRTASVNRLYNKMGKLSKRDMRRIARGMKRVYLSRDKGSFIKNALRRLSLRWKSLRS